MTRSLPRDPLIIVLGATGTGKSQLAVEIAKRHNGEIINGDAMQLYAGLPIITNKITTAEQQGIPHHLLGCIGLHEQTWVVGTFVRNALNIIQEIRSRGRMPILVGGTHYYTQSLLFRDRLAVEDSEESEHTFVKDTADTWPILREPTSTLLDELRRVDPIMADRWHPNDRRKIQRSLEIYLQTGRPASEIYAEQRRSTGEDGQEDGEADSSSKMRFPTLLFWTHTETEMLRQRLDGRVDKMLEAGLIDEVQSLTAFVESRRAEGEPLDETRGICVSIGYKEFRSYADALSTSSVTGKELVKLKQEALERTKISTRQYAKRQLTWIRIKLVNALNQTGSLNKLFLLDASDASRFNAEAVEPALNITQRFLEGETLPKPVEQNAVAAQMLVPKRDYDLSATPQKWSKQYCDFCDVTCVTPEQWTQHAMSKMHKKRTRTANGLKEGNADQAAIKVRHD